MLTEKENILSSTGNLSLTNRSLNESDIEHVSKIAIQLGKIEKENDDLRVQLESSITEVEDLRLRKDLSCVMCREGMKNAQIEKDREICRLEKRFNEEIEEMENLLFEVQQKLADRTKEPMPEGKYWIFMQREEYDDLVQRDEKLSKRITDIENQLQSTEQQIEEQSAAIVHSQPMSMVQSMVNDNHELENARSEIARLNTKLEDNETQVSTLQMRLEKNDAWSVANEEIKTLQEIIRDANAKLQNQENELRKEQSRGNELEQKIYEAQIKLGEIEKTEEENKDQLNITSSHQHELENELKDTIQKNQNLEISIDLLRTASNKTKESLNSAEERISELVSEKSELKDDKMVLIDQLKKLQDNKNFAEMESSQMGNLYLKAELDELKTKHVALASKYIKLKDRTRQKLSAAKKVMEGERRIAEEIEKQMRNTLHEYESQINDGHFSRAMIEGNLNKSTELAKSFRDELENITNGAHRKQQLVEDLDLKVLAYSRDKAMLQAQLKERIS